MFPIVLALIAAAGFFAATCLAETGFGASARVQRIAMLAGAGILLGVAFTDLIPETFELLDVTEGAIAIALGFLALFSVEALTGGHTHHHEPHVGDVGHAHAHSHSHSHGATDGCVPAHAILPFLIGLFIHNFADGIVIGASDAAGDDAAGAVAIGLLVHQLPVGLSFAAVLVASGRPVAATRRAGALVALAIPFGTLLVMLAPGLSGDSLGFLVGIAAGALVYVATGHLLPEAQSEQKHLGSVATFAIALVATVLFIGAFHDDAHHEDEHESGSKDHRPVV